MQPQVISSRALFFLSGNLLIRFQQPLSPKQLAVSGKCSKLPSSRKWRSFEIYLALASKVACHMLKLSETDRFTCWNAVTPACLIAAEAFLVLLKETSWPKTQLSDKDLIAVFNGKWNPSMSISTYVLYSFIFSNLWFLWISPSNHISIARFRQCVIWVKLRYSFRWQ